MERYRKRLIVGAGLMIVGFLTVLVVMSELLTGGHLPAWTWGLFLLIGVGAAVLVSAFVAAGRDRRRATEGGAGPARTAPKPR